MPFWTWFFLIVPPLLLLALEIIHYRRKDEDS